MHARLNRCLAVLLPLACALPGPAAAHAGADMGQVHATLQAAAAGFSHPFTGLDHWMAMIAVGVWSGLSQRSVWRIPTAFAVALLTGALLGGAGLSLPATEPMIAASLLALGLLVAGRRGMPWPVGAALAAVFALFHGAAHGMELAAGSQAGAALGGMLLATALLHIAGCGLGRALRRGASVWPRLLGSGVACCGLVLLARGM